MSFWVCSHSRPSTRYDLDVSKLRINSFWIEMSPVSFASSFFKAVWSIFGSGMTSESFYRELKRGQGNWSCISAIIRTQMLNDSVLDYFCTVQVVHNYRISGNKRLIKCKQWSLSSIKVFNVVVCEFECVHSNYFMAEYPMKIPFII